MNCRRRFLVQLATVAPFAAGNLIFGQTPEQAPPGKLEEADPLAQALGYKHDTTTVDKQKFPQHQAGQTCDNCTLYVPPKAGDDQNWGPCSAVGNKLVASKGWCIAYARKP